MQAALAPPKLPLHRNMFSTDTLGTAIGTSARACIEQAFAPLTASAEGFMGAYVDGLVAQQVDFGKEVFGPTYSLLARLSQLGQDTGRLGTDLGLETLEAHWMSAVEGRSSASSAALRRILDFTKTNRMVLLAVTPVGGDPHNGGQTPVKFTVQDDAGIRDLIYKAVPDDVHRLVFEIAGLVCKQISIAPIALRILHSGDGYFIRDFCAPAGQITDEEARHYYFSYGVVTTIAMLLQVTDLHFENIVVSGSSPVIIDAEALATPAAMGGNKWSYVSSTLYAPEISPLSGRSRFSMIAGSLSQSNDLLRYSFRRSESYELHVAKSGAGQMHVANDHASEIAQGATAAMEVIRHAKRAVIDLFQELITRGFKSRVIVRNTSLYKILQMRLWTPAPTSFTHRLERTRRVLTTGRSLHLSLDASDTLRKLVDFEIACMLRGDIPYIWSDVQGDLFMGNERLMCHRGLDLRRTLDNRLEHLTQRRFDFDFSKLLQLASTGDVRARTWFAG